MDFTVELALCAERRLTIDALISVAAIGGVAGGHPGGRRIETVLTVRAKDAPTAAGRAITRVSRRVPGAVIAVTVMTTREADRLFQQPVKVCIKA